MVNVDSLNFGDSFKLNDVGLVCVKRFYLYKRGLYACWNDDFEDFILLDPATLVERI